MAAVCLDRGADGAHAASRLLPPLPRMRVPHPDGPPRCPTAALLWALDCGGRVWRSGRAVPGVVHPVQHRQVSRWPSHGRITRHALEMRSLFMPPLVASLSDDPVGVIQGALEPQTTAMKWLVLWHNIEPAVTRA